MSTGNAQFLPILLEAMRRLLEEERTALLSGSAEQITAVTQRKLALADQIERECPNPRAAAPSRQDIAEIARFNQENALICSTMLNHMTAALDNLRGQEPHRSYAADGTERTPTGRQTLGSA